MTTKKRKSKVKYEPIRGSRINHPLLTDDGLCSIEVVSEQGEVDTYECSTELYRELVQHSVHSNFRVDFTLYKNTSNDTVEYITSSPKNEYRAYQVEYADSIDLPTSSVFIDPTE